MEAYEAVTNHLRAPYLILPMPLDADGATVTTTGAEEADSYPLVPVEATIVATWQLLLSKSSTYPRAVLWNKVRGLEPLLTLGYEAFNELVAQFHLSTDLSTHCLRTLNGAGTR